jgi:hypothetical protein
LLWFIGQGHLPQTLGSKGAASDSKTLHRLAFPQNDFSIPGIFDSCTGRGPFIGAPFGLHLEDSLDPGFAAAAATRRRPAFAFARLAASASTFTPITTLLSGRHLATPQNKEISVII